MCKQKLTLDNSHGAHIVPYSKGGTTTSNNLVMLHANCNLILGNKDLDEWIKENDKHN